MKLIERLLRNKPTTIYQPGMDVATPQHLSHSPTEHGLMAVQSGRSRAAGEGLPEVGNTRTAPLLYRVAEAGLLMND